VTGFLFLFLFLFLFFSIHNKFILHERKNLLLMKNSVENNSALNWGPKVEVAC
jgi:hypothetical protein